MHVVAKQCISPHLVNEIEAKVNGETEMRREQIQVDDEEAGKRSILKMMDPKLPSKVEVEAHEMTHLPFRNWCRH